MPRLRPPASEQHVHLVFTGLILLCLSVFPIAGHAFADPVPAGLAQQAAGLAARLAALCPTAPPDRVDAHTACARSLRDASLIPFAATGLLFGSDQPETRVAKKQLTHLNPGIFRFLYLSLFSFTGNWSVTMDERDHVGVIQVEAYFRNAMPPGEFPYPFWHSADKWNNYETANRLNFYLNHKNEVFIVTRSQSGSEANRGPYAHVTPPAFDGRWQWRDASGQLQPHVSLFANRYSADNPNLGRLDDSYRDFAIQVRKGACLECHAPNNEAGMSHLVLLQTPLHASGEIEDVLREVRNGQMPRDDLGLAKDIPADLRTAILRSGETFRGALQDADRWEAGHPER